MKKARNIWALVCFEALYKSLLLILVFLGGTGIFRLLMRITGYSYLTPENVLRFIKHPATVIAIVLLLLISGMIYLLESVSLLVFYQGFIKESKIRVIQILIPGLRETWYLLKHRRSWLLVVFSVIGAIVSTAPVLAVAVTRVHMPEYLTGAIIKYITARPLLITSLVLLLLFYFLGLYLLYYCVLGEYSISESYRKSVGLICRHPVAFIFGMLGVNLAIVVGWLFIFLLLMYGSCYLVYRMKSAEVQNAAMLVAYEQTVFYMGILLAMVVRIVNYAFLSRYFSRYGITKLGVNRIEKLQEQVIYEEAAWQMAYVGRNHVLQQLHGKYTAIVTGAAIVLVIVNIASVYQVLRNGAFSVEDNLFGTYITSHRGASKDAPENTIPALVLAIEQMADYAEIDVQETRDGTVVLMHDLSLHRTTGNDVLVSDVTIEEIRNLEAGAWFSSEYSGIGVPTLEEVFELCKGQIVLNIELKVSRSKEQNQSLVTKVVELINEYDMENQCVISAASLPMLEMVKEADGEIRTGYILAFAYGDYLTKEYVDFFSIRYSFITERLVRRVHAEGKEVHAWTVNTETELERMKQLGVDNIITDRPLLAREVLNREAVGSGFIRLMQRILRKH